MCKRSTTPKILKLKIYHVIIWVEDTKGFPKLLNIVCRKKFILINLHNKLHDFKSSAIFWYPEQKWVNILQCIRTTYRTNFVIHQSIIHLHLSKILLSQLLGVFTPYKKLPGVHLGVKCYQQHVLGDLLYSSSANIMLF